MTIIVKINPNRLFFINEYWILVPSALIFSYFVTVKIKKIKAARLQKDSRATTKSRYENLTESEIRFQELAAYNLALRIRRLIMKLRGGQEIYDDLVDYPENGCDLAHGTHYLNDLELRNLISKLYWRKSKNGVILITRAALCYLVETYFVKYLKIPLPFGVVIGIYGYAQAFKRLAVVLLVVGGGLSGFGVLQLFSTHYYKMKILLLLMSASASLSGVSLAYSNLNFGIFSSTPIDFPIDQLTIVGPRIPGQAEAVVVDLPIDSCNKLVMPSTRERPECLLPEQKYLNPKCQPLKLTQQEIVEYAEKLRLKYEDVVNMNDVTRLEKVKFSDRLKFQSKPVIKKTKKTLLRVNKHKRKGRTVNFSDKFKNPKNVPDNESWNVDENSFNQNPKSKDTDK